MKITRNLLVAGLGGLAVIGFLPLVAAAADPAVDPHPPVKLDRFVVNEKHLLCFGLAIEFWEDKNTQRVLEMYIKAVRPDSMAELEGLVRGTRIYGIEGIPVESFKATFAEGSELNKIFIDRKNGDRVTLEVKLEGHRGTKYITLVERTGLNVFINPDHPK